MNTTPIDWNDPKYRDPMEELYAIRHELSAEYDHDVHKLCEAVRQKEAKAKALGMTFFEYCFSDNETTDFPMVGEGGPSEKYQ